MRGAVCDINATRTSANRAVDYFALGRLLTFDRIEFQNNEVASNQGSTIDLAKVKVNEDTLRSETREIELGKQQSRRL